MRVDFYQLEGVGGEASVLAAIAGKLLEKGDRLVVTSEDEAQLATLDRQLWREGRETFLAHGREGGADDTRQPILLSTRTLAPNEARHIALADGKWRPAALDFDRAFMLFGDASIDGARAAWKELGSADGVERHYWAREDGRWTRKA